MDSLSSKFILSSPHSKFLSMNTFRTRTEFTFSPFIIQSKNSRYQDFHEYAKPSRLLPVTEADASVEKGATSFLSAKSECSYKLNLQTSNMYGSGLTDVNSGVLLCLIDENGSSILQRLPAVSAGNHSWSEDHDSLRFQRGSTDEFSFEGPSLGKIVAVWIGVESGQWRIGDVSLSIIHNAQPSSAENNQEIKQLTGLQYKFEVEDVLIGEKSELSMMEFRPSSVTAFSVDGFTLFDRKPVNASASFGSYLASNEESMKEYADLKFSLLFYDTMLILAGSSIASFSVGENAAYSFLTGGMFGFLYLLLLQRSVDGLPAQELVPTDGKEGFGQIFERLKGPISSLVLAFSFAIITVKYASGEDAVKLTPKDLIFGTMGFLMCKVSVVLAAFKPMPLGLRDNK